MGQVVTTFGSWHLEKIALAITTTYPQSETERGSKHVKKTSNCGSWVSANNRPRKPKSVHRRDAEESLSWFISLLILFILSKAFGVLRELCASAVKVYPKPTLLKDKP